MDSPCLLSCPQDQIRQADHLYTSVSRQAAVHMAYPHTDSHRTDGISGICCSGLAYIVMNVPALGFPVQFYLCLLFLFVSLRLSRHTFFWKLETYLYLVLQDLYTLSFLLRHYLPCCSPLHFSQIRYVTVFFFHLHCHSFYLLMKCY